MIASIVADGYKFGQLDSSADSSEEYILCEMKNISQVELFHINHFPTFILNFTHLVKMYIKVNIKIHRINYVGRINNFRFHKKILEFYILLESTSWKDISKKRYNDVLLPRFTLLYKN